MLVHGVSGVVNDCDKARNGARGTAITSRTTTSGVVLGSAKIANHPPALLAHHEFSWTSAIHPLRKARYSRDGNVRS